MPRRSCKTEFIEKSNFIHQNKYNYDEVIYTHNKAKVKIKCESHGYFYQRPNDHLKGWGCDKCRQEKLGDSLKLTLEEFIKKAISVHGDRYDYSKFIYEYSSTKGIIICSTHGEFEQRPNDHLNGQGCPICKASKGELLINKILTKNNINFIPQYRIPDQIYKFRYDFYLPKYNVLLEFHGRQHYKYIPYFHNNNEDDFLRQKERDMFKKELAKILKFHFLEFNFTQLKTETEFENLLLFNLNKLLRTRTCGGQQLKLSLVTKL